MSRKRQIKRLMALGIQRNDAAGFVKASRILMDKGMHHLLPAPLCDPLPIIVSEREMRTFVASYTCSRYYAQTATAAKETAELIKIKLGQELGIGLLQSGLCKIQAKTDMYADAVRYQAIIDVAEPKYDLKPAPEWTAENPYMAHHGYVCGIDLANGPDFTAGGGGHV